MLQKSHRIMHIYKLCLHVYLIHVQTLWSWSCVVIIAQSANFSAFTTSDQPGAAEKLNQQHSLFILTASRQVNYINNSSVTSIKVNQYNQILTVWYVKYNQHIKLQICDKTFNSVQLTFKCSPVFYWMKFL